MEKMIYARWPVLDRIISRLTRLEKPERISFFLFFGLLFYTWTGFSQTNPAAQSLPYSQDFSGLVWTSSTYPSGWQGWKTGTAASSSYRTTAPTADQALTASSSASTTAGGIHNYNGKIGILTSNSFDGAIALAINTTGLSSISVAYDVMTIRNPYDGTTNTRINEMTLQYRVGTSGTFITLTGIEYQNNTTTQTSGTTPQNSQIKSIILPAACNNSAVVQLRWEIKDVTGSGSRPSFAVDNIYISGSSSSSGTFLVNEEFTSTTGNSNLTSTTCGFTSSGSWISYSSSTYNRKANALKFTASGTLLTPTFSGADMVCFWAQNNSGATSGTIDVQAYNGSWSSIGSITVSNYPQMYFFNLNSDVTQVQFVFTYGTGDVCFDDVMIRASGKCSSNSLIERVLVNSCNNTLEGRNELLLVDVGSTDINVSDLLVTFPSVTSGGLSFGSMCAKTIVTNPSYTASINTVAGCTAVSEPSGGVIPANSKLVIFTGATPEFTYDFSSVCGSGENYIVIFCNNTETSGRFRNDPDAGSRRYISIMDMATGCYDQVYYDGSIPNVDGEEAVFDLTTRALSYKNYGCNDVLLPIELISFNANCEAGQVILNWATASEINNDYFTIEKSADLESWQTLTTVEGAGNSNHIINYAAFDESPNAVKTYYRLKQTDFDGASTFFGPVSASCEGQVTGSFDIYPNPSTADHLVNCSVNLSLEMSMIIDIYDMFGQHLISKKIKLSEGNTLFTIDISNFSCGLYNIFLRNSSGSYFEQKQLCVK